MHLFSSIIEVNALSFPRIERCVSKMCIWFFVSKDPFCFKNVFYRLCIRATGDQPVKSERESGWQKFVAVYHVRPSAVWGFSFQCLRMQDAVKICFGLFGFWALVLYIKIKITGSLIWKMLKMCEDTSVIDILKALVPGSNLLGNNFYGRINYSLLLSSCLLLGIDVVF